MRRNCEGDVFGQSVEGVSRFQSRPGSRTGQAMKDSIDEYQHGSSELSAIDFHLHPSEE